MTYTSHCLFMAYLWLSIWEHPVFFFFCLGLYFEKMVRRPVSRRFFHSIPNSPPRFLTYKEFKEDMQPRCFPYCQYNIPHSTSFTFFSPVRKYESRGSFLFVLSDFFYTCSNRPRHIPLVRRNNNIYAVSVDFAFFFREFSLQNADFLVAQVTWSFHPNLTVKLNSLVFTVCLLGHSSDLWLTFQDISKDNFSKTDCRR